MSLTSALPWLQETRGAIRRGRRLVLRTLSKQDTAPTLRELFDLTVQEESKVPRKPCSSASQQVVLAAGDHPQPPYPTHIIRSMHFLKKMVIPDLLRTKHVRRVHATYKMTPEEFEERKRALVASGSEPDEPLSPIIHLWRFQARNPPIAPNPKERKVFGEEVGVGADWSHLNKRRQRSRAVSVVRDVRWLKKLEQARREALQESKNE